jgi:hypothetical protein
MIVSRDRPIAEVQQNLTQQSLAQREGDDPVPIGVTRYGRRTTTQDAVLPGTPSTLKEIIHPDVVGRKERLVKTLDGDPVKGTVVVAIRGSEDSTDFKVDALVFSTSTVNRLKGTNTYKEIKNHIQENLRLLFSVPPSSYKANWDVFATGHSLGGAITDQLILDGVVKGGVTYSAPRTVDSKFTRPSYAIINADDSVIGTAFGQKDSRYDLVVTTPRPKGLVKNLIGRVTGIVDTMHSITYLEPSITANIDRYGRFNNELFSPTKVNKQVDLMTGRGAMSDDEDMNEDEMSGSGRAPVLKTFYEAAKNAYDHGEPTFAQSQKNFLDEGLLLPELTLNRFNKAIVQFYVFSTPKFNYNEMPIRTQIEQAVRKVARSDLNDAKLAMLMNNF